MKLDAIIEDKNVIGIAGHVRPDGDCVGSTLAVYNYIASAFPDKNIHIFFLFFLIFLRLNYL